MGSALRHPSPFSLSAALTCSDATRFTILIAIVLAFSVQLARAQSAQSPCPSVGADTNCGVVLTILDTGNSPCPPAGCVAISNNQGPYDTIDDTLVGIINNSKVPITSLVLTSGAGGSDIFGFDDDGICGLSPITNAPYIPGPPACPYGPTGYEGPGVSFSDYAADPTAGTVSFKPPIPANGGTAYFSLENSLTQATACSDVVNGSVPKPNPAGSPTISGTFTPNDGYTIAQAAKLCGFADFDWQQYITSWPLPSPLIPVSKKPPTLSAPPAFLDPPSGGGYTYELTRGYPTGDYAYPFYLNPNLNPGQTGPTELKQNEPGGLTLEFSDTPTDPCLFGGHSAGVSGCNGKNAKSGQNLQFQTHLVGLYSNGTYKDLGIGFNWTSNFNGKSGGAATSKNLLPADPGSGTGGVTVTSVNEVTSYQYPKSFTVIAINGVSITPPPSSPLEFLAGDQISATASGLAYSRVSRTFDGTVTIKNVSDNAISGPFQAVLVSLTTGATLTDATSSFGGWPFVTVSNVGVLAPVESATFNVQFSNPLNTAITFSPIVYSGTFN